MRIADTVNDSIVDGAGMRFTVFVQGCFNNCEDCQNPQTHDINGGTEVEVDALVEKALSNPMVQGVTISGGEPFLQAEECARFASACKSHGVNIWTYTGYTYEDILKSVNRGWKELLENTDVLVDGEFMKDLKSYALHFRGSSNQRLIDVQRSLQDGEVVLWEEKDDELSKFTVPRS